MSAPVKARKPRQQQAALPVLGVASELFPLLKTGGLADVTGALPAALEPHGVAVTTLLPGHPAVLGAVSRPRVLASWDDWFGGRARLLRARHGALDLLVLDAAHLYARPGNPYLDTMGRDWPDNALRFAALALAAARIAWGEVPGLEPALVHLHDWQAALTPAYLHFLGPERRRPPTVLTLHNLAFQGWFDAAAFAHLGLPPEAFAVQGVEYHGGVGFLKAGLKFADAVTTVSPSYAREILGPEGGMGLDGVLRWREAQGYGAVTGIVNGIDTEVWNPAADSHLIDGYSEADLTPRAANRRALEQRFGLAAVDGSMLVCMVSRLTWQKGIDLVAGALDGIVEAGMQLAVLGTGDAALEAALLAGAARHPGRVSVHIGYDERLAHLLHGGADAILVPSRFEPCGLTQLSGLRYGCVPVVSRVGGLADTVIDATHAALAAGATTGIKFDDLSARGVLAALRRAQQLHRDPARWLAVQRAGMRTPVGWDASAGGYAALYRRLVQEEPLRSAPA